jgi:hypothetical protein
MSSVAKPFPDWFSRRNKGPEAYHAWRERRDRLGTNWCDPPKHTRPVFFEGPDGEPTFAWWVNRS